MTKTMKFFAAVTMVVTMATAAAAVTLDLGNPAGLSAHGKVSQAPGADNGLVFMAHLDCAVTALPDVVKKVDWKGGSVIMTSDLPIAILRGEELTVWYNRKVTPQGFVEETAPVAPNPDPTPNPTPTPTPAPTPAPTSGDVVASLEALRRYGTVSNIKESVWVEFSASTAGQFGGELVGLQVTGFNVTAMTSDFVAGGRYYVADADTLENKGGEATKTIAGLKALSAPYQADTPKSGRYEDGNLWVAICLPGITSFYFDTDNVLKVDGGQNLLSNPDRRVCYRADGSQIGTITVFLSRELSSQKGGDGDGGSGGEGGGGCDAGFGSLALALVALALRKQRR